MELRANFPARTFLLLKKKKLEWGIQTGTECEFILFICARVIRQTFYMYSYDRQNMQYLLFQLQHVFICIIFVYTYSARVLMHILSQVHFLRFSSRVLYSYSIFDVAFVIKEGVARGLT